jgi:uncharacterized lipoprotein YbaY/membrane-bound inhibitor of C-type lysozyme
MKRLDFHRRPSVACLAFALLVVTVATGCASGRGGPSGPLTIRGELMTDARIALPAESMAIVELARAQDGRVVAEQRQPLAGRRFPIPFELKPHPSAIEGGAVYLLRAAIAREGRTGWVSDAIEVRARLDIIELGTLMLKPFQPVAFRSPLRCGDRTASVGVARIGQRDFLQLTVGSERFELYETVTASGARYEAVNDSRTFVWFKGQRATLIVRGERYPECVVAD